MPLLSSVRGSFGPQGKYTAGSKVFATGGDIVGSYDGYRYHIFNNSGTLTVTQSSTTAFVEIILVGAGGNGNSGSSSGPGGGAGALYWRTNFLITATGNYPIVIGQPGSNRYTNTSASTSSTDARGGNTTAFDIIAYGGGGAGWADGTSSAGPFGNLTQSIMGDGGSGAGGYNGANINAHPDGSGTYLFGRSVVTGLQYYYGNNSGDGGSSSGGGGGGAGAVGDNEGPAGSGGAGGAGMSFNWTGTTQWLAGGGGAGGGTNGRTGGSGVGGNGGSGAVSGTNGVANTGSGGGGSGSGTPGFGSAGTVWIRYSA